MTQSNQTTKTLQELVQLAKTRMTSLEVINFIATHPEFEVITVLADDDRRPMEAIATLSSDLFNQHWNIQADQDNNSTLLIY